MRCIRLVPAAIALALAGAGDARAAGPTGDAGSTAGSVAADWKDWGVAALAGRVDRALAWVPTAVARLDAVGDMSAMAMVALRDAAVALGRRTEAWLGHGWLGQGWLGHGWLGQGWLAAVPAPPVPDLTVLTASPVPGVESSGFGWRRDPIRRRITKFHKGTDFRADRGTPVYAAGAAVVAFAGVQRGYGKVVYLDHGGGLVTRYAHLSRIEVEVGAAIGGATRLGRVGATGRATGPHLHFEVRIDDRAVDPEAAMRIAALQRTDPAAARLAGWALSPAAQATAIDRHDPPRPSKARGHRPERRGAPTRDRNRS